MKKSKKTRIIKNNPNTSLLVKDENVVVLEEYLDTRILQMTPVNNRMRIALGLKLIEWVTKNAKGKAISIERFLNQEGIPHATFYRWCGECPELGEAHKFAMSQIGLNREDIAVDRNLTYNHVTAAPLPIYLKSYADSLRFREEIKQEQERPATQVVVIEKFAHEVDIAEPERIDAMDKSKRQDAP